MNRSATYHPQESVQLNMLVAGVARFRLYHNDGCIRDSELWYYYKVNPVIGIIHINSAIEESGNKNMFNRKKKRIQSLEAEVALANRNRLCLIDDHERRLEEERASIKPFLEKLTLISYRREQHTAYPSYNISVMLDGHLLASGMPHDEAYMKRIGQMIGSRIAHDIGSAKFVSMSQDDMDRMASHRCLPYDQPQQ